MRDIDDYSQNYLKPGFEQYKVEYRRKKILELLQAYNHKNILEIGCGTEPLFTYLSEEFKEGKIEKYTFVEPSDVFYDIAASKIEEGSNVVGIKGIFDSTKFSKNEFDFIICASLLHELEDPAEMVREIECLCSPETHVLFIVPNADSFHRQLGVAMHIIEDTKQFSENNIKFQQNSVFDETSLCNMLNDNGMDVMECRDFFIKPFSHEQMYNMMEQGIINNQTLDALYLLSDRMKGIGSELYAIAKIK